MDLRYYQREALDSVLSCSEKVGVVHMATGTGKSLVQRRVIHHLGVRSVLVVVPSIVLVKQTRDRMVQEQMGYQVIAICSGEEKDKNESSVVSVKSPKVKKYLDTKDEPQIYIITKQSLEQFTKKIQKQNKQFQLLIVDEAHHITGCSLKTLLQTVLCNIEYRFFFTATPVNRNNVKMIDYFDEGEDGDEDGEEDGEEVLRDERLAGRVLYSYSVARGIEDGYLQDFQISVSNRFLDEDNTTRQLHDICETDCERVILFHRYANNMPKEDDQWTSVASFCLGLDEFERGVWGTGEKKIRVIGITAKNVFLTENTSVWIRKNLNLNRKTNITRDIVVQLFNKENLIDFENTVLILSTCNTLNEGIDTKYADGDYFIDGRSSYISIIQGIGRCLRKKNHNNPSTILVDLDLKNMEQGDLTRDEYLDYQIKNGVFDSLFRVLSALRQDDKELFCRILTLPCANKKYPGKQAIQIQVPDTDLSEVEMKYEPEFFEKLATDTEREVHVFDNETLHTSVYNQEEGVEKEKIELVLSTDENTGEKQIYPQETKPGPRITMQPSLSKKSPVEINWFIERFSENMKLAYLKFNMNLDDIWKKKLDLVKKYVNENKKLPVFDTEYEGEYIGDWCSKQRQKYKNGGLSREEIKALEKIQGWYWSRDEEWTRKLNFVEEYVEENGKLPVKGTEYEGVDMGYWCNTQRQDYRNGKLDKIKYQDKIKALEKIQGWYWSKEEELKKEWLRKLNFVKQYVKENGEIPTKGNEIEYEGVKIGIWCSTQRTEYNKGKLSHDKIKALEDIPGWWWDEKEELKKKWLRKLNFVKQYVKEKGELPVPDTEYEGVKIGDWCSFQRTEYKKGGLSQEEIKDLEDIPGWCWSKEDKWRKILNHVQQYVKENGKLPTNSVNYGGFNMGKWCIRQRQKYKNGGLSQNRIKALEDIPGWCWDEKEELKKEWLRKLNFVKQYVKENGEIPTQGKEIEYEGVDMGNWCIRQRQKYKNGGLSREEIKALEKIQGWYWSRDEEWTRKLNFVEEYVNENGKLPVKDTKYEGVDMGYWCDTQRQDYRNGKLDKIKYQYRIKALEKIQGWYWSKEEELKTPSPSPSSTPSPTPMMDDTPKSDPLKQKRRSRRPRLDEEEIEIARQKYRHSNPNTKVFMNDTFARHLSEEKYEEDGIIVCLDNKFNTTKTFLEKNIPPRKIWVVENNLEAYQEMCQMQTTDIALAQVNLVFKNLIEFTEDLVENKQQVCAYYADFTCMMTSLEKSNFFKLLEQVCFTRNAILGLTICVHNFEPTQGTTLCIDTKAFLEANRQFSSFVGGQTPDPILYGEKMKMACFYGVKNKF